MASVQIQIDDSNIHSDSKGPGATGLSSSGGFVEDMPPKMQAKMEEDETMHQQYKDKGADSSSNSRVHAEIMHAKMQAKMGMTCDRDELRRLVDDLQNTKTLITMQTNDLCKYMPLYKATLAGDWETTIGIISGDKKALTAPINHASMTALQIAVEAGKSHLDFVKKLVKHEAMSMKDLEVKNNSGNTALSMAAIVGNTAAAEILVKKNPGLLYLCNEVKYLPVHEAAVHGHKKVLLYLRTETNEEANPYEGKVGVLHLLDVMAAQFYDVAFDLIEEHPSLAITKFEGVDSPLTVMSRNPSAFRSGTRLSWWERLVYSVLQVKLEKRCEPNDRDTQSASSHPQAHRMQVLAAIDFKVVYQRLHFMLSEGLSFFVPHIKDKKMVNDQALRLVKRLCKEIGSSNNNATYVRCTNQAIIEATKNGIPEVIEQIADILPLAIWSRLNGKGLFQLAVVNRCEKVFNLIYQMRDHKQQILTHQDSSGNNILHLVGKVAPPHKLNLVSGAALQMQREIQWYNEVKKHLTAPGSQKRNNSGETPAMVFSEQHKQLVVDGEKWMKDTATSCSIAATLIVTMVFGAAITVPGGLDQESGKPIFSERSAFKLFFMSNAISLFTSTTSLLMFLSILTARYTEEDFHITLPNRLIIGLLTLFLSTTTMMISFSSILYLFSGQGNTWSIVPTIGLACLPITSFVTLQFPLLVDLISSTYGCGIFGKQCSRSLY